VHIQNFSPEEIVEIAEQLAVGSKRTFEPGLKPLLAKHIRDRHSDSPDEGNGRLARRLVFDIAEGRRSERLALLWREANNPIDPSSGAGVDDVDEAMYIASDFGIGDKLGENEEAQRLIDDSNRGHGRHLADQGVSSRPESASCRRPLSG